MDDYIYLPYPKVLYHHTAAPITVPDADAHDALGPEWREAPYAADTETDEMPVTDAPKKKGRPRG